jgi:signal transduction histidine kinase
MKGKPMAKHKRRITIIKKNLQFSFVISFVILGGALATASFALSRLFFSGYNKAVISMTQVMVTESQVFFISIILVALLSYLFGIWSSHKVAGPLYRMEKTFRMLKDGDFSDKIFLRKGDFLHESSEVLNRALEGLRDMVKDSRKQADEIENLLASIKEKSPGDAKDDVDKAISLVREIANKFAVTEDERV